MDNIDTSSLVGIATEMYHMEYMREEYADNLCHELILEEECRQQNKTIEETDAEMSADDIAELECACDALPGYEPYDDIVRMIQCSDKKMSLDAAMGIEHEVSDAQIVAELEACMKD